MVVGSFIHLPKSLERNMAVDSLELTLSSSTSASASALILFIQMLFKYYTRSLFGREKGKRKKEKKIKKGYKGEGITSSQEE